MFELIRDAFRPANSSLSKYRPIGGGLFRDSDLSGWSPRRSMPVWSGWRGHCRSAANNGSRMPQGPAAAKTQPRRAQDTSKRNRKRRNRSQPSREVVTTGHNRSQPVATGRNRTPRGCRNCPLDHRSRALPTYRGGCRVLSLRRLFGRVHSGLPGHHRLPRRSRARAFSRGLGSLCPVCGGATSQEKCKVICRSETCVYRIVYNCAEF